LFSYLTIASESNHKSVLVVLRLCFAIILAPNRLSEYFLQNLLGTLPELQIA
jgi:hypothetical protein